MSAGVRLLDRKLDVLSRLPPGSLQSSAGPYAVIEGAGDVAEWDEGPYHIWLKFQKGIVAEVEISRAQMRPGVKPDPGLAMRFAPENINIRQTSSTVGDRTALVKFTTYEWARGPEIIRLSMSAYLARGLNTEPDDLDKMRWSIVIDPNRTRDVPALIRTSDELTKQLEGLGRELDAAGDFRGGFMEMHTCMARGITNMARQGRFKDPGWVLRLNIAFIEVFLEEWKRWQKSPQHSPEAWRTAYEVANAIQHQHNWPAGYDERIARDRVILLMAGAHILHDIPICLNRVGCGTDADFSAIEAVIDQCERAKLGDWKKLLKDIGVALSYPGANSIKDWRNAVWNHACHNGPHPREVFR